MFVDSHCHLADPDFDSDREAAIERARDAGVRYCLAIGGGSEPGELGTAAVLAKQHEGTYATIGVHPHEARHFRDHHFEKLRELSRLPKVIAVGEIGLDYRYQHSTQDVQKQVLIWQLEMTRDLKLPIIVHCREAWGDLREIAKKYWQATGLGGILHCFTGTRKDAFYFLDCGFLISFAGNLTFKNAGDLRGIAREIPLDRLLTETDSPYLTPVPYRGKRNEPAYVREVTRELGILHNLTEEGMGEQAVANFERFFHLTSNSGEVA
jgi:TatD DNase family protein